MSLYEPSVRSSTWSLASRRFSRPFTTLEGWREIGLGVYTLGNRMRMFSTRHQFDPEKFQEEEQSRTLPARLDIPPVPAIPSVASYGHLMRPPGSGIGNAFASPAFAPKIELHVHGEKRKEVWDEVLPEERPQKPGPYHVFSPMKKWVLVVIVGVAGIFPSLTPNIYLPTLNQIGTDFDVGLAVITPTISVYLFFQGIAALFWAPISDTIGRRPVYLYSLLTYIIASLVLSFSPNFPVLLVFRGVQAAAIASTVCIGSAVIQDLSPPAGRDGFLAFYQGIRNLTTIFAPFLGGLLTKFLGFRSVFVFLLSLAIAALVLVALFLPETLRSIAGNGSSRLTGIHQRLVEKWKIINTPATTEGRRDLEPPKKLVARTFVEPLALLKEKDIALSLAFGGLVFAVWMMVTVSTAGLFRKAFGLNELLLGLAFIPNALGTIAGSTLMGNILNRDVLIAYSKYKAEHALPTSTAFSYSSLPADFPLERTRLHHFAWILPIFIITLSGYGFTLTYPSMCERPGWILIPLLLQFTIGATAHAICGVHQALVTELWHQNGHASMSASNLTRCLIAAVGVGIIQLMLDGVGTWSTFVALGLVVMVMVPVPVTQWYCGSDWRAEREARRSILERVTRM